MKKILLIICFIFLSQNLFSQDEQFGKNKVQYKHFKWSYIQSSHFDIYFYEGGEYIAQFTASAAESAYLKIKESFKYSINHRIPIMVYNSHNDFQQTNVISEYMEEGVGGVTELFKNRVVVPFEGNYKQFRHVIHHELVHAVINEMFYGGSIQNLINSGSKLQLPGWFNEGLAEFEALRWDANSDMFMRDATINTYIPPIDYLGGYFAYRGGQSVWHYITQKYGDQKISEILHRIKGLGGVDQGFKSTLGLSIKELDERWQKEQKIYYWPDIAKREEPKDFATQLTKHTKLGNFYNTSPSISPQGNKIAFISDMEGYLDVYLMDLLTEKIKKIVDAQRTSNFEELHLLTPGICWSPDGKKIAFSVKSGSRDAIFIVDIESEKQDKLDFKLDAIFSVDWSRDGKFLTFIGNNSKQSDVYKYNLETKELENITNDVFTDSDPVWSLNGEKIYFVSDRKNNLTKDLYPKKMWEYDYSNLDIYSIDVKTKEISRLINFIESDETSPQISSDGKSLFFISDKNGINNIYKFDLEKNISEPITNSLTGIYQLSISSDGEKMTFSSLHEAGFDIFLLKNPLLKNIEKKELELTEYLVRHLEELKTLNDTTKNIATSKQEKNKSPLGEDFVLDLEPYTIKDDTLQISSLLPKTSQTKITDISNNVDEFGNFIANEYKVSFSPDIIYGNAAFNTFYGAQGTTVMAFSDLLGDHQIYFLTSMLLDLKNSDYTLAYFYLPELIDYGVQAFHTARFLYLYDAYGYQTLYRFRSFGITGSASLPFDKFNRLDFGGTWMNLIRENQSYVDDLDQVRSTIIPSISFVHDNVLWGYTSPNNGTRWNFTISGSPKTSKNSLQFTTFSGDVRKYWRIFNDNSFVVRGSGGISLGQNAQHYFIGGTDGWINREFENGGIPIENVEDYAFLSPAMPLRGWNFNTLNGTKFALMNLEYRFPLIRLLVTGGIPMAFQNITGVAFVDMGSAWTDEKNFKGFVLDENLLRVRKDFLGSVGTGVRLFLFGMPLKIDVAWSYLGEDFSTPRYLFSLGGDF